MLGRDGGGVFAVRVGVRAEDAAEVVKLPVVEVIGSTPLAGVGLEKDQMAAPVQTGTAKQIERSDSIDLPGCLLRFLGNVYVNDMQSEGYLIHRRHETTTV